MKGFFGLILFAVSTAGIQQSHATILPPNDLHLQDNLLLDANIDEAKFNAIIDNVGLKFEKIVAIHGGNLSIDKRWKDATVNASAQQIGKTWKVNMYGGLARRTEVTPDGFALVVCHELGHHLGGYPFYVGPSLGWAASEGQADYFATQVCAKKLWENDAEENAKAAAGVDPYARQQCDNQWSSEQSRNICYRTAEAGRSLANLFAALRNGKLPKFETPDPAKVSSTFRSHPASQCRLDTYFEGALCLVRSDVSQIPGRNHPSGQESEDAEKLASFHSCTKYEGQDTGLRPRCWYKPLLTQD